MSTSLHVQQQEHPTGLRQTNCANAWRLLVPRAQICRQGRAGGRQGEMARPQVQWNALQLLPVAVQHQKMLLLPSLTSGHCIAATPSYPFGDQEPLGSHLDRCKYKSGASVGFVPVCHMNSRSTGWLHCLTALALAAVLNTHHWIMQHLCDSRPYHQARDIKCCQLVGVKR